MLNAEIYCFKCLNALEICIMEHRIFLKNFLNIFEKLLHSWVLLVGFFSFICLVPR